MIQSVRILAVLAATVGASGSAAAAERPARAAAHAAVVESMTVRMQWATAMPSVRGSPDGAVFMGVMPSMAMGMMMPANARLIMRREDDTGEPVTAPVAFQVGVGGANGVVVRTGATADIQVGDAALARGTLSGQAAASVDVAGALIRVSTGGPIADAAGTLVVLVQYN